MWLHARQFTGLVLIQHIVVLSAYGFPTLTRRRPFFTNSRRSSTGTGHHRARADPPRPRSSQPAGVEKRSVGGPGNADTFIVSLADGYDISAHLNWLSGVMVNNGGAPIPGYPGPLPDGTLPLKDGTFPGYPYGPDKAKYPAYSGGAVYGWSPCPVGGGVYGWYPGFPAAPEGVPNVDYPFPPMPGFPFDYPGKPGGSQPAPPPPSDGAQPPDSPPSDGGPPSESPPSDNPAPAPSYPPPPWSGDPPKPPADGIYPNNGKAPLTGFPDYIPDTGPGFGVGPPGYGVGPDYVDDGGAAPGEPGYPGYIPDGYVPAPGTYYGAPGPPTSYPYTPPADGSVPAPGAPGSPGYSPPPPGSAPPNPDGSDAPPPPSPAGPGPLPPPELGGDGYGGLDADPPAPGGDGSGAAAPGGGYGNGADGSGGAGTGGGYDPDDDDGYGGDDASGGAGSGSGGSGGAADGKGGGNYGAGLGGEYGYGIGVNPPDADDPYGAGPAYPGPPGEQDADPVGTADGAASSVKAVYPGAGVYVATLVGSIYDAVNGKYGVLAVSADDDFWVAAPELLAARADPPPPPPETTTTTTTPAPKPTIPMPRGWNTTIHQNKAPWHLPMLSSRNNTRNNKIYNYNTTAGTGVDIYIIDSGVNVDHKEFQGRAKWGFVAPGYGRADKLGHGTHVAGLAAGKTYGVAKGANIIAVKVMGDGGAGAASDIIAGIDWAITQAVKARKKTKRRSVINLSLSGPAHPGLDKMVTAALKKNIPVAIAAGNTGDNAAAYSPGRVGPALTAGAIDKKYTYWHMSARGHAVDILAPGVDVLSTWITSNVATTTLSGSSMSSPQVAGLIAYHLSLYPLLSVKRINRRLKRKSTKGLVTNSPQGMKKIGVLFNCWNEKCYPPKNITEPVNTTTTTTSTPPPPPETTTAEITTTEALPEPTQETPPPEPVPEEPAPAAAAIAAQRPGAAKAQAKSAKTQKGVGPAGPTQTATPAPIVPPAALPKETAKSVPSPASLPALEDDTPFFGQGLAKSPKPDSLPPSPLPSAPSVPGASVSASPPTISDSLVSPSPVEEEATPFFGQGIAKSPDPDSTSPSPVASPSTPSVPGASLSASPPTVSDSLVPSPSADDSLSSDTPSALIGGPPGQVNSPSIAPPTQPNAVTSDTSDPRLLGRP